MSDTAAAPESVPQKTPEIEMATIPLPGIKVPAEVYEAVHEAIADLGVTKTEWVLHFLMIGAGYEEDSIMAVRKKCYPQSTLKPIKKWDEGAEEEPDGDENNPA